MNPPPGEILLYYIDYEHLAEIFRRWPILGDFGVYWHPASAFCRFESPHVGSYNFNTRSKSDSVQSAPTAALPAHESTETTTPWPRSSGARLTVVKGPWFRRLADWPGPRSNGV